MDEQMPKKKISKPMLAWLCFNGLVLLWILGTLVFGIALRVRLVFWYDKQAILLAITVGALMAVLIGWCILGLRWLFRLSKLLGAGLSVLLTAAALPTAYFLTAAMVLGLGIASIGEWEITYFNSPENRNTLVVFFGGDMGASTSGPFYAAYPMVCKGVYRYEKGNSLPRFDYPSASYVPPTVEWLSEKEAEVHCYGQVIDVAF